MAVGLNGQPVLEGGWSDPRLVTVPVVGTSVSLTVHKGWFQRVAAYVALRWHAEVEPLVKGQCWGYDYRPARAAGGAWSSHSTGYCVDLNSNGAGSQLWGDSRLKATDAQLAAMARIKADTGLLWGGPTYAGGDYEQPRNWDPMHWDLPKGLSNPEAWCKAMCERLRIGPDGRVTAAPAPASSTGPAWLMGFLKARGVKPLRAWWAIAMRESRGDPACLYPAGAPWGDWRHGNGRHFDTGLYQINDRHCETAKALGYGSDMRWALDPEKNLDYALKHLSWSDWGLKVSADGSSYSFDWTGWPADWVAKNAAAAEQGFRQWWDRFPQYAGATPAPGLPVVSAARVNRGLYREVRLVQIALNALGYRCVIDGRWGKATQSAYDNFRRGRLGLTGSAAIGPVGEGSLASLGRAAAARGFRAAP